MQAGLLPAAGMNAADVRALCIRAIVLLSVLVADRSGCPKWALIPGNRAQLQQ
jgi:hypothetical protein